MRGQDVKNMMKKNGKYFVHSFLNYKINAKVIIDLCYAKPSHGGGGGGGGGGANGNPPGC